MRINKTAVPNKRCGLQFRPAFNPLFFDNENISKYGGKIKIFRNFTHLLYRRKNKNIFLLEINKKSYSHPGNIMITLRSIKRISANNAVCIPLVIISGIIWGLGQYPQFFFVRFFGLIPFIFIVFFRKHYLADSILFGLAAYMMNFYWLYITLFVYGRLPVLLASVIPVALCLYYGLQYPIIAFIYKKAVSLNKKIFYYSLPVIFTAVDFIFPKLFRHTIGDGQIGFLYFIQLIDITGMSGVILIFMFFNMGLFDIVKRLFLKQKLMAGNFIFAVPLILALVYGFFRLQYFDVISKDLKTISAVMIQGNVTGIQKLDANFFRTNIDRYNRMTGDAANNYRPDLIIWPESVFNRAYDGTPESLKRFILDNYPPLVLGIVEWVGDDISNTAILVKDRKAVDRYDKQRLLIFGEYVPFEKTLPFLKNFTLLSKSEKPGKKSGVFEIKEARAGMSICFEDIFPELQTQNVAHNANILINLTNDSWYGYGLGPLHHSILARLRGIENRRSLFRCTSTGLSTASDPTGRVIASGIPGKEDIIRARLPLYDKKTVYFYTGESLSFVCVALTILIIISFFFGKKYRKDLK
jgi:apolipoprotein N-acyltransferase